MQNQGVVILVGRTTTLNQVNVIPETPIVQNSTTTPIVWYTCPAGKKAIIKGFVRCVDRGAAANASFEAGGIVLAIWNNVSNSAAAAGNNAQEQPENLSTFAGGMSFPIDVELTAGQTIRGIQNSGSNAQFKINVKVKELPA